MCVFDATVNLNRPTRASAPSCLWYICCGSCLKKEHKPINIEIFEKNALTPENACIYINNSK